MAFWFTCASCAKEFLRNGRDPVARPLYCSAGCKSEHFDRERSRCGPLPKTYNLNPLALAPLKSIPVTVQQ